MTAVDEQTNEALGTTAAALSAGEELRPSGSDRGLLRQLTRITGGKQRDTLAGIFADRDALRFAYQNLRQWLVVLAAGCLLLGVASRRLAVPDFMLNASSTVWSWVAAVRQAKTEARQQHEAHPATESRRTSPSQSAQRGHAPSPEPGTRRYATFRAALATSPGSQAGPSERSPRRSALQSPPRSPGDRGRNPAGSPAREEIVKSWQVAAMLGIAWATCACARPKARLGRSGSRASA